MVINKTYILILLIFFFKNNILFAAQILDYQAETFVNKLIIDIKKANNIEKHINFRILSDRNINAFVDQNNTINITAGLIEYSPDYVALLSVLAHEVGHIDRNHIRLRQNNNKNTDNFKNISNLSVIAGSMISGRPELLQGLALNYAGVSNIKIKFSKEQEKEADFYSLDTLKKLNKSSDSIIKLLKIIEKKGLEKGLTKEMQRTSSHPYFEERIDIINFLNNKNKNFDNLLNKEFKLIQAKFLGYNDNFIEINKLEKFYKLYSNSIIEARSGSIYESMKKLNLLIKENEDNVYFIETKADILFSYGYTKEAIQFYEIVLNKIPKNIYAQIRIFNNKNIEILSNDEKNNFFLDNLNLIEKFYKNTKIISNYLQLSKSINKKEWVDFLMFLINNNELNNKILEQDLDVFKFSKDEKLLKLINIIESNL